MARVRSMKKRSFVVPHGVLWRRGLDLRREREVLCRCEGVLQALEGMGGSFACGLGEVVLHLAERRRAFAVDRLAPDFGAGSVLEASVDRDGEVRRGQAIGLEDDELVRIVGMSTSSIPRESSFSWSSSESIRRTSVKTARSARKRPVSRSW